MGLKTIDLAEVKRRKNANMEIEMKRMEERAKGSKKYRDLLKVFVAKFESLCGRKYDFKQSRVRSHDVNGKNVKKFIPSDGKRLSSAFKQIMMASEDMTVCAKMLEFFMDKWFEWEKCAPNNVVGFLENTVADENNITEAVMHSLKARKRKRAGSAAEASLNRERHASSVESHRGYFAMAS